jgi:hypothetical protein
LKKAGNLTGTLNVLVRKGTAGSVAITFAANDKVLVEWDGTSGTSTDQVHVKRHYYSDPATSIDGINTRQVHKNATSTGYSTHNYYDMAGVWYKLE